MAKTSHPHLCVDRSVPPEHKIPAAAMAVAENKKNEPVLPKLLPGASLHPQKIALFTGKMWKNGRVLRVGFLDGSKVQRAKVEKYATAWSAYANIRFQFTHGSGAQLRVSFEADSNSWSAIGTDCLVRDAYPKKEPTINFGWLRDDTDEIEYRRVVTHEFGHALGAIHEHQNPKGGIEWNLPKVFAYFSGPPNNWSEDDIYSNVVMKYSLTQLNSSKFDRKSIMLYSFPKELIVGGKGTPENTDLSAGDKKFIAKWYPK